MYSIIKTYYVELFKKRDWFDKAQKNQDLGKMNQWHCNSLSSCIYFWGMKPAVPPSAQLQVHLFQFYGQFECVYQMPYALTVLVQMKFSLDN